MKFFSILLLSLLVAGPVCAQNLKQPVTTVRNDLKMKSAEWRHTVKGSYKEYQPELAQKLIVGSKWAGVEIIVPLRSVEDEQTKLTSNKGEMALRGMLDIFCSNYSLVNYKLIDQFDTDIEIAGQYQIIHAEGNLLCLR